MQRRFHAARRCGPPFATGCRRVRSRILFTKFCNNSQICLDLRKPMAILGAEAGERHPGSRFLFRFAPARKNTPEKRRGDVRPAPASRAGAIRRANRAGANGRARPRAIRAEQGPAARESRRRREWNEAGSRGEPPCRRRKAGEPGRNAPGSYPKRRLHARRDNSPCAIRIRNMTKHDIS